MDAVSQPPSPRHSRGSASTASLASVSEALPGKSTPAQTSSTAVVQRGFRRVARARPRAPCVSRTAANDDGTRRAVREAELRRLFVFGRNVEVSKLLGESQRGRAAVAEILEIGEIRFDPAEAAQRLTVGEPELRC